MTFMGFVPPIGFVCMRSGEGRFGGHGLPGAGCPCRTSCGKSVSRGVSSHAWGAQPTLPFGVLFGSAEWCRAKVVCRQNRLIKRCPGRGWVGRPCGCSARTWANGLAGRAVSDGWLERVWELPWIQRMNVHENGGRVAALGPCVHVYRPCCVTQQSHAHDGWRAS